MDNLPARQSAFSQIRNNILKAGLRNNFTRNIMANVAPNVFGYALTSFVLNNDNKDLSGTMQLLSSMNQNAVKVNISRILRDARKIMYGGIDLFGDHRDEELINKVLDAVTEDSAEIVALKILDDAELLKTSITDETCKRIADSIDCSNKTTEEIDEILKEGRFLRGYDSRPKIAALVFDNLIPEQKKTHFSQIVPILAKGYYSYEVHDYSKIFEQFPPEDRLEQYEKILDFYRKDTEKYRIFSLSTCFSMLTEEERITVLQETVDQIERANNGEKARALSKVISLIPSEEKDKYHNRILDYCNKRMDDVQEYVRSLDRKQQEEVVYDVISKLRNLKENGERLSSYDYEIRSVFEAFNPEVINDALVHILNGAVDAPDFKFVVDTLRDVKIRAFIESTMRSGKSISPNQLELASRQGIDIEGLTLLYVNTECDRLVQEFLANPSGNSYQETIQKIVELSKNVKIDDNIGYRNFNKTSDLILSKKKDACTVLFYSLDDEEKRRYLKETVDVLISLQRNNDLTFDCAKKIKVIYETLDEKDKIALFPEVIGKMYERYGNDYNGCYAIDSIWNDMDPSTIDAIYELWLNMINEGEESEEYETIRCALKSEQFKKGLIKSISKKDKNIDSILIELSKLIELSAKYEIGLFEEFDNNFKVKIFEKFITSSRDYNKVVIEILKEHSIKQLNEIFKGKLIIDEEKIMELISLDPQIALKTLLFDKDVDRQKIIDLDSYEQLKKGKAIDINYVIQSLYARCQGKSKQEFNQLLAETYNLFTYNNVPEFMKNFRIFQLGAFYDKQNERITSFQGKTNEERDSLILEDLFKISLDSNNGSLRDFANIIFEGKQITTKIQSNPEEKLKTLSTEEIALLNQYRDTLFDLHNLTKEIRKTDRPRIEKTGDVLKDIRKLIAIYSDNKNHNVNSKNIVFNPNKIMDELFGGFITTSIRPKAMLEYMDRRKTESDERHLIIEQQLRDGTMHLEAGDFVKGIQYFDSYLPCMLSDGVKGGEFNQENSHSDYTPLDADFGYVSKANLTKEGATDYDIIATSISGSYGQNYIVLKNYAERLQDRSRESFDQGTFTGSPDYYAKKNSEELTHNDRYIRTGIPVTDIDYIVSKDWNPKNGYEMAMAGIYIPVINPKGEIVFSSDEYRRIREEMRGLSHYGADNIVVSKDAANMDALYAVYREISPKTPEEIDSEIETVRGLVAGKPDSVTEQKKKATTKFIRDFFKTQGIRVTDDLSQNLGSQSVELIDTGSTGRGTNVPGDGDFDFMLRHNLSQEIITALADRVKTLTTSDSEFVSVGDGFRTKKVTLPTGEVVDIDVTTAKKSLALSYSSDMCVRDRLENIRENSPESYNYVKANIIMAKKILKSAGIYKKLGSNGATKHGGFGGIGVENWILQNGGSFKTAIDTFLEAAKDSASYDEFKKKYPIFDFGFNHREGKIRHDRFSAFFKNDPSEPGVGFEYVKVTLEEIQKTMELEMQKQEEQQADSQLLRSISPEGFVEAGAKRSVLRNNFSYSRIRGMVSKFMALQESEREQATLEEV